MEKYLLIHLKKSETVSRDVTPYHHATPKLFRALKNYADLAAGIRKTSF
jgi:hypothetical protein